MIVTHPAFPDITKDVADDEAAEWIAAGWLPPYDEGGVLPKGKPAVNATGIPERVITAPPKTPRSATTR